MGDGGDRAPDPRATTRRHFITGAVAAGAVGAAAGGAQALLHRSGGDAARAAPGVPPPSPTPPPSRGGLVTSHCVLGAAALLPDRPGDPDAILRPPPAQPAQRGRLRHVELTLAARDIEVAKGRVLHAWAFNGSVPGPTIRVTQGDSVEVVFRNTSDQPHTIHFHGIHAASMDGVEPLVPAGGTFTYRFVAQPFGLFVYHCHMTPLADHVNHGMYGAFIIDPPRPRPPAQELVFVMNGYSFARDGTGKRDNDVYSVNGPAGYYVCNPIPLRVGEPVRAYVVNMTEFDPLNSFHLHGNVFKQIASVNALDSPVWDDTVALCQGQRAILEFSYPSPGRYMIHAHQSDITEKGWAGFFDVT